MRNSTLQSSEIQTCGTTWFTTEMEILSTAKLEDHPQLAQVTLQAKIMVKTKMAALFSKMMKPRPELKS